jgi:hypothetical protein
MLQETLDMSDNSSSAPGVEKGFFSPVKMLSQFADDIRCMDSLTGGFYKSEAANGRSYANQPPETKKKNDSSLVKSKTLKRHRIRPTLFVEEHFFLNSRLQLT